MKYKFLYHLLHFGESGRISIYINGLIAKIRLRELDFL